MYNAPTPQKKLSPITPGDVLVEEFLRPMSITQNQLAKDINVPANRISQIIHGKREISADTALRLGRYFGIEPVHGLFKSYQSSQ
jgi:addiction module HigA family antidote